MQKNAVAGIRNHDQQSFLCCIYEGMLYGGKFAFISQFCFCALIPTRSPISRTGTYGASICILELIGNCPEHCIERLVFLEMRMASSSTER
jgi:hypothetical protein